MEEIKQMKDKEELAAMRSKNLQRYRAAQAKNHKKADFSQDILKARLKYSQPLQRLYERIYFDDFNLVQYCEKYDKRNDSTMAKKDFQDVVYDHITCLSDEQCDEIIEDVPRLDLTEIDREQRKKPGSRRHQTIDDEKEVLILYKTLYKEMRKLADQGFPIRQLYTRYEPEVKGVKGVIAD